MRLRNVLSVPKRHVNPGTGLAIPQCNETQTGIASMLTIILRRSAAAASLALAFAALPQPAAAEVWTSSCAGGWRYGSCVLNYREYARDTYLRYAPGPDSENERKEAIARDRKWAAFCKPVVVTDRYGIGRYLYTKPGCEFGRSE